MPNNATHYTRPGRDTQQLLVYEREFTTLRAARACVPPAFTGREITGEPSLSGASLARRFGVRVGAFGT